MVFAGFTDVRATFRVFWVSCVAEAFEKIETFSKIVDFGTLPVSGSKSSMFTAFFSN
jgi:hypothetical protein